MTLSQSRAPPFERELGSGSNSRLEEFAARQGCDLILELYLPGPRTPETALKTSRTESRPIVRPLQFPPDSGTRRPERR